MLRILLVIAKRWGDFGDKVIKWYNSGKSRFSKYLIIMCVLFLAFSILFTISGLMMLYLPRLCTFLILIFVLISFGITVPCLFLKKINAGVWVMTMLLSFSLLLIGVGLLGFGSQVSKVMMQSTRRFLFSEKVQFPLTNLSGIAIDNDGRIYLAIQAYDRIQVYSSEGNFIKGWFVDAEGGGLGIWIEDDDLLHVCTRVTGRHDVFDPNGLLLERREITSLDENVRLFEKTAGLKEQDIFGNTYIIKSPAWSPHVTKTTPTGHQIVLVRSRYYFWLMHSSLGVWFVLVVGLAMFVTLWKAIRKKVDFSQYRTIGTKSQTG
jgi:hypothetical protein